VKRLTDNVGVFLFAMIIATALGYLLIPVIIALVMSFDVRDYLGRFPPPDLSLQWYKAFFTDAYYMDALANSAIVAVISASISTTVGVAAAVFLDRYRFPGREALSVFFLSPLIVPTVIIGFALLIFFSILGVFDGYVRLVGGHVIITLPYTIRTTLASLVGIRRSLIEAALSLGADERKVFWAITFPLAKTGMVAGAIFALSISLDDLALSLFLVDPFSTTLPVALLTSMRVRFNLTIAAASGVLVVLTAGLIFLLDRLIGLDKLIGTGIYRS
jgi:putative spermidine/putrescine transport system permease protein